MFDLAPALVGGPQTRHRPRVLAFVQAWSMEAATACHLRRRLAQLDSELVIVCDEGAWAFDRGRQPLRCELDVATARELYDVTADAVFLLDHRGFMRFAHRPDRPLEASLTEALDAAAEALEWRGHQTKLELIRWTPREWALKCLVVGCSLTFAACPPVQYRRFARGTEPIRKLEARDTGEPTSRMPAIREQPAAAPTAGSVNR